MTPKWKMKQNVHFKVNDFFDFLNKLKSKNNIKEDILKKFGIIEQTEMTYDDFIDKIIGNADNKKKLEKLLNDDQIKYLPECKN